MKLVIFECLKSQFLCEEIHFILMISFTLKEKGKIQNQQKGRVNGQSSPKQSQSDDI